MPGASAAVFVKEPGKTKTIFIEPSDLQKTVEKLRAGDELSFKIDDGKLFLFQKVLGKIAEINHHKISKKIIFLLNNQTKVEAWFVSHQKTGATFLLKSSLPVFSDERDHQRIKPYVRHLGENEANEEKVTPEPESSEEEVVSEEEKNPLAGLRVIDKNKVEAHETEEEV